MIIIPPTPWPTTTLGDLWVKVTTHLDAGKAASALALLRVVTLQTEHAQTTGPITDATLDRWLTGFLGCDDPAVVVQTAESLIETIRSYIPGKEHPDVLEY